MAISALSAACGVAAGPAPSSGSSGAPALPPSAPVAASATARVLVRNGTKPGELEVVALGAVELGANLLVERQTKDGGWQPVGSLDLDSMKVVETCAEKLGPCVALAAGRTLRPVAWSGMSCSSQCNGTCDKNVQLSGRHRFVVTTCDRKERFEGPAFELAP